MKKAGFWTSDWFFALVIAIVFFALSIATGIFKGLETKAYDWGVQATAKQPSDKVAVIAIDEQSLANIGRWPWPRDIHAAMIDKLTAAKAKVIGNTIFYFEPQQDPGLQYISKLLKVYAKSVPAVAEGVTTAPIATNPTVAEFGPILYEAEQALNTDRRLAESVKKSANVVLASLFDVTFEPPAGKPDKPLPEFIVKNVVTGFTNSGGEFVYAAPNPNLPIDEIGAVASGIGHLSANPDADGGVRQDITVIDYFGQQYPSLAMLVAAKSLNLGAKDIRVNLGESVSLGNLRILTDERALMRPYFYKPVSDKSAIPVDSFFDVISGKIPATKYADKIVLIGATAPGIGTLQVTPIGGLAFLIGWACLAIFAAAR